MSPFRHYILLALAIMLLTGCGEQMGNHVIAQNDEFCVTGDSVIAGDITVWAKSPREIANELNLTEAEQMLQRLAGSDTLPYCLSVGSATSAEFDDETFPQFQSQQTLVDALYRMALADVTSNYSQTGGFNSHDDHSSLYGSIYLSLAMLNPERSMLTLEHQVVDGLVEQGEGTWPVCDDRMGWPIAAWEVYCMTGDEQWLAYAYEVTLNTIDEELAVQHDMHDGLWHGGQLARYNAGDFYPDWATAIDLTEIETMINSTLAVRAMETANLMADELQEAPPYEQEALRLREAINQQLWDESRGRYSAYLMGRIERTRSPLTDNLAQALAVMWDLADDDRSTTLVEQTPIGHRGILPTYPSPMAIEPHLEHNAWTLTQACWNVAAATVGNEHALRRGLAALYRAQALYQPRHLGIEGHAPNSLASAAANAAMLLRVMAGMRFTGDGIEFAPTVPSCFVGNKNILNFAYRQAVLDITIVGTGNDIDIMTLDGQPVEGCYISGDIVGHHNLLIKLKQGKTASRHVTLAADVRLPNAPVVVWDGDSGRIADWLPSQGLKLAINGERSYSVSDSVFRLPPLPTLAELTMVSTNRYGYSLPSCPTIFSTNPPMRVALPDTLLSADTLALEVRAEHAGRHLMTAEYGITDGCDIILVEVNGHMQGALIMPSTSVGGRRQGNLINLQLLRGTNSLILRRYRIGYRATVSHLVIYPTHD